MLPIAFAVQGAPSGGLDTASIVVVALLAGGVLLVWWASRPSVIARYAVREPDLGAPPPAAAAEPASGSAPFAREEAGHAGH